VNLFDRIGHAWSAFTGKAAPSVGTSYGWGGGPFWSDAFKFRRSPSLPGLAEAYKSLIFTCVRINADAVSRVPLRLVRISGTKGDRAKFCDARPISKGLRTHLNRTHAKAMAGAAEVEEITGDHPLLNLIQNVNPSMDHAALINYTVMSMDVVGTSFWWPTEELLGCPREFWPLPPHLVYPVMATGSLVPSGYYFGAVQYTPDDLVIFKHLSMKNPYGLGMSPTQAAIEYARLEDTFISIQDDLLSNGPRPSVIVSHKDPQGAFGEAERKRLEHTMNQKARGGRAGDVIVVDGAAAVTPVSWAPADLGAVEISKYDLERTCGCFGIPVSMVTNESSNRAVSESGLEQHARNAVEPRCKNIASTLTRWTHSLDRTGKRNWSKLQWVFDSVVPEDLQAKAELDKMYLDMGVITRNEVRTENGYEPDPDGDELLVSNNLVTLESIISGANAQPAKPGQPEEEGEGEADDEADDNDVKEDAEETDEIDDEPDEEPQKLLDYATDVVRKAEYRTGLTWEQLAHGTSHLDGETAGVVALTRRIVRSVCEHTGCEWDAEDHQFKAPCRDERGRFATCPGATPKPKKPRKPRASGPKPPGQHKPRSPRKPQAEKPVEKPVEKPKPKPSAAKPPVSPTGETKPTPAKPAVLSREHRELKEKHREHRQRIGRTLKRERRQLAQYHEHQLQTAKPENRPALRERHQAERRDQRTEHQRIARTTREAHRDEEHRLLERERLTEDLKNRPRVAPEPEGTSTPQAGTGQPFRNAREMERWGKEHYGQWARNLTDAQSEALSHYTEGGYESMNKAAREGNLDLYGKANAEHIRQLDAALRKAVTPDPITVYRGIGDTHAAVFDLAKLRPGDTIAEKGFTSTSLSRKLAADQFAGPDGAMLEIRIPKGSHGGYVNATGLSRVEEEREFVLPLNAARYKVRSVEHKNGVPHITVDLIGDGGAGKAIRTAAITKAEKPDVGRFIAQAEHLEITRA
jgi:HK97 family phage portal protein